MFVHNVLPLILDLVLLLFISITIYRCYKKGFIHVIFVTFRKVFALIIAYFGASKLGVILKDRFIMAPLKAKIGSMVENAVKEKGESVETFIDSIPSIFHQIAGFFNVDFDKIAENAMQTDAAATESFVTAIADKASGIAGTILGFIILFIVAWFGLMIIFWIVDRIFELPILNRINRLLGLTCGVISSFFTAWIVSYVLVFIVGFFATYSTTVAVFDLQHTYLIKFFYNFNPIKWLI